MSKKMVKSALEIVLLLELSDRDKLDVLHVIGAETSSEYTAQVTAEMIKEIKDKAPTN